MNTITSKRKRNKNDNSSSTTDESRVEEYNVKEEHETKRKARETTGNNDFLISSVEGEENSIDVIKPQQSQLPEEKSNLVDSEHGSSTNSDTSTKGSEGGRCARKNSSSKLVSEKIANLNRKARTARRDAARRAAIPASVAQVKASEYFENNEFVLRGRHLRRLNSKFPVHFHIEDSSRQSKFRKWETTLIGEDLEAIHQMRNPEVHNCFFQYLVVKEVLRIRSSSEPDFNQVWKLALVTYRRAMSHPFLRLVIPAGGTGDMVSDESAKRNAALKKMAESGWKSVKALHDRY